MNRTSSDLSLRAIAYLICLAIMLPIVLVVLVSLTTTPYLAFPPEGVTLKWYLAALTDNRLLRAMRISAQVGVLSAMGATVLGVIGGLFLAKSKGWMSRSVGALFLAPLTVPMIVIALGFLFFFSSIGLVRSMLGLVIGHVVITFPYAIRMVSASIGRDIDQLERAAAVIGASPMQSFLRVTFPSMRAGIVAGLMFAFLVSFNNVTIALFIAGARTQTLPVLIFQLTKEQVTPDLAALASMLVLVTYLVMIVLENKFGIYRLLEQRRVA